MARKAFTLVEVLVVLAIILLMAALLYPVFRSVRDRANTVSCVSRLRQIGFALQMYSDDHESSFPIGAYHSQGLEGWDISWHDELIPYLRSWQPLVCPAAPSWAGYRTSLGVNRFVSGYRWALKTSQIPIPADVMFVTEKLNGDWPAWTLEEQGQPYWQPLDPRHGGKVQVLFVDGHVAAYRPEFLVLGRV